jgi:hypothetical protein
VYVPGAMTIVVSDVSDATAACSSASVVTGTMLPDRIGGSGEPSWPETALVDRAEADTEAAKTMAAAAMRASLDE